MRILVWTVRSAGGLWILTRDPVASDETTAAARAAGVAAGFDLSVLRPVEQKGCTYEGFPA